MATRATKASSRKRAPSPKPKPAAARRSAAGLPDVLARLESGHEALREALREVPRAADFQPLADHLYEFARIAPTLHERLGEFAAIVETLQALHAALSEAVALVPRADEFEPLAGPLREFATVAPALGERLADVVRAATPLADSAKRLQGLDAAITRLERLASASPAAVSATTLAAAPLGETPDQVARARALIIEALETLPRRDEYAPAAAQLREIASVSPTLLDWMAEVPRLSAPLRDSVERLYEATALLAEVEQRLIAATRGQ